jgi:hypothetical protein
MKTTQQANLSKRMRRALEAQVQEYVDRYYPERGKVIVGISPCGTFASVRGPDTKRPRKKPRSR